MNWNDILDELIGKLQPDDVPVDYIIMAKIVDRDSIERIIKGNDLTVFMADPEKGNVREARVILDVRKIRRVMHADILRFFAQLPD